MENRRKAMGKIYVELFLIDLGWIIAEPNQSIF